MLKLYQSNCLEQLVDLLAATVSTPLQSPFAAETVVVQHPGMGHWLSLRLAERLGICANVAFPLPAGFIWGIFRAILDEVPEHNPFEPALLAWRILGLLDEVKDQDLFKPVSTYLADDSDPKRYDLACRIAETFDQYLLYRPDWIKQWEAGHPAVAGDGWQAELWRRLSASSAEAHWIQLQQHLHRLLLSDGAQDRLPERISLFGISTLSPGYLETLRCLSERVDTHLFLLNPCAAHWAEIVDKEMKARSEEEAGGSELYLEVGHPLLASLGRQGRDFFASILEYDPGTIDRFEPPENRGLLGQLQQDICDLRDRTAEPKQPLPVNDRSLQFHSCHSIMREVEVLKDQLLEIFQKNRHIEPSDVLVMSPAMERYAAYIEAVFSSTDATAVPYQIVDKSVMLESPLVAGFFNLLQIDKSRFDSNSIMALLEITAIQRCFGLAESDLELIVRWIRESGIRWGHSGAERAHLGLPRIDQNSWRAGLDRMLLGYALPGGGTQLFQGILPYDEIEGVDATLLGALNAFIDALSDLRARLQGKHTVDAWGQLLLEMVDSFFDPSEQEEPQIQLLRNGIETLCNQSQCAEFRGKVSLELIYKYLETQLAKGQGGNRALSRGVTFCSLASMRGLPYKVISLIGMNDGDFPKHRPTPGFDLMAGRFRFGDRIRRADDRYLFLETLISARHTLYISFVGQHIRDNSNLPPSGLVDELLDYLDRCYYTESDGAVRDHCIIHHPLQPFSRYYFQPGSRLLSYSKEMYKAHQASLNATTSSAPFLRHRLPETDSTWRQVELKQLIKFFSNPARYFVQHRLGIYYEREEEPLKTTEPFALDYFAQCELSQALVEHELAGEGKDLLHAQIRASGDLPHGRFGDRIFEQQRGVAKKFADRLKPYLETTRKSAIEIDLCLNGMQLYGCLNNSMGREGQFGYSAHTIWKNQLLELWINHLVLNRVKPPDVKLASRWLDDKKLYSFAPVDLPEKHLGKLLDLYWEGLHHPLHFFPKSSCEYMEQRLKERRVEDCLDRAKQKWGGEYVGNNEGSDPYYRLAFPDEEVFDESFITLSEQIYRPLLEHLQLT